MLTDKERRAVHQFVRSIRASSVGPSIKDVKLFGSKAKGTGTSGSDIDVLVIVETADPNVRTDIVDLAFETNLDFDVYISPRVVPSDAFSHPIWSRTLFIRNLQNEAIPL
ncbi:MAG TPA: nucleotidyltransferase domain-containing protein [Firmicutes bacterium]|nr:nucleotidyltransferase domain-containing protein [Bacillota bacterium]